jgi:hypothetical protein
VLGFFTLVSLVVAFKLGGWWWAGFVLLFLAWLGKRGEAKEQQEAAISKSAEQKNQTRSASPKPANAAKPMVSVNNGGFDELLTLPGVGAAEAQLIIKRRGEKSFSSNMELVDYLELKPHMVSRLDALTDFSPSIALSEAQTEVPKQTESNAPRPTNLGGRTID